MKLSVIIPCYNEINTIEEIITTVKNSPYEDKEIVIIDDCSTDGTRELLKNRLDKQEVGISYYGRTYDEGKKIGLKDGFRALYCIIKYNVFGK